MMMLVVASFTYNTREFHKCCVVRYGQVVTTFPDSVVTIVCSSGCGHLASSNGCGQLAAIVTSLWCSEWVCISLVIIVHQNNLLHLT